MKGYNGTKKFEKLNEWSKPVKGGQRVEHAKDEKKSSNGKSNNRHDLFEDKDGVDEDENKNASDVSSEEDRSTKGKKPRNNLKKKCK